MRLETTEDGAQPHNEPPRGWIETELSAIWCETLGKDRVCRQDNFFKLGGDSVQAMRVIVHINQWFRLEAEIVDMFVYPELSSLADRILSLQVERLGITDINQRLDSMKKQPSLMDRADL